MTAVVTFLEKAYSELEDAMQATDDETVVFALGGRVIREVGTAVLVDEIKEAPDSGYRERSRGHFRLEPRYVAEVLLDAAARDRTAIIVHSHPGVAHPPSFSAVDERMHQTLMPSFLRELRPPVGSLVWSGGGLSGSFWDGVGRLPIDEIRVVGEHLRWISHPLATEHVALYDRQIRAFGQPVQDKLASLRVAVVGLGGTGSLTAQWLAHLGVRSFVLCDPDALAVSNVSRVVGSSVTDVGLPKAEIAERNILQTAPDARVQLVRHDVTECVALRRITTCDVIFSCTDSHSSRAALNAVSYQYAIPMLDVGSLLRPDSRGVAAWSELRFVAPGLACLRCQGLIDPERVFEEQLRPDDRRALHAFGYAPGERLPEPSVLPVNALGVSLATLRLLDLLEPWLDWDPRVTVQIRELEVNQRRVASRPECDICGRSSVTARGDDEPLRCRN